MRRSGAFVRPISDELQEGAGHSSASALLVETLFNVIMPLSLKFLIDDALGEEDFEALFR